MKKNSILLFVLAFVCFAGKTQTNKALSNNREFTGATASKNAYKAIYQLDSNDPKTIQKAFRNINNALSDTRLQGKLKIELVAFSGGTEALLKNSKYENELKDLLMKGVIIVQCNNSLKERNIERDQLFDFIGIVPSGNGELIIRQADGWSLIKP
jgi:uncharacterized protein